MTTAIATNYITQSVGPP